MWRRRLLVGTGVLVAGSPIAAGVFGARAINQVPRRDFEGFHMVPEELHMPFERLDFVTDDGIRLRGWFIPQTVDGQPNDRCVMFLNPYNSSKSSMLGLARGVWEAGNSLFVSASRWPQSPCSSSSSSIFPGVKSLTRDNAFHAQHYNGSS